MLFERAAPTVVDVRGGAAATYDTASLSLEATFGRRWALFFAGGSLFGLDAAAGIRRRVLEEGGGHRPFRHPMKVAPVSGAALFDLPRQGNLLPDYRALGWGAARRATDRPVPMGSVGAGAGATVGKYFGRRTASPGGLGSASVRIPRVGGVGAIAVVNAVGAIRDPSNGRWVAGARAPGGEVRPPPIHLVGRYPPADLPSGTNLVAVVTDARLTRPELARVAILAQTGLARCVVPTNTATDGDVVFAASTARGEGGQTGARPGELADMVGAIAAQLVVTAVLRAVERG